MWMCLLITFSFIIFFYKWFTAKQNYFMKLLIPSTRLKFPFGDIPNGFLHRRNALYDFSDIYEKYRKQTQIVGYFEGRSPKVLIISPEAVKKVLITNFKNFHDNQFSKLFSKDVDPIIGRNPFILRGQEWKDKRSEIIPAFSNNRIRAMFPLVGTVLARLTKYLNSEYRKNSNKPFEIRDIAAKFTVDLVSSCIFNINAESFTKVRPEILLMGRKLVNVTGFFGLVKLSLIVMFPEVLKILKIRLISSETENFFMNLMKTAVELRESSNAQCKDFLSFLLELKKQKNISDVDMAAHGVTFFTDGFETSSLAIAHILYELGDNPSIQQKLRSQINDEILDKNGQINYEKMLSHKYLNQVFYEALRLHQPIGIYNRECTEEINLDCGNGTFYKIEKGMGVNVPIHCIHRDSDYYFNPNDFFPERFNDGVKKFTDQGVLAPFGMGPRVCLGKRFAEVQVKAAVVEIVRNFELSINEKTQRPLVIEEGQFLNIKKGGLWINVKPIQEKLDSRM